MVMKDFILEDWLFGFGFFGCLGRLRVDCLCGLIVVFVIGNLDVDVNVSVLI